MVLRSSHKKNVTLCALIVLGAFISGVKCIGQSCSSSSDCGYLEKCCRQTSVGICHLDRETCLGDYCSSNTQCPRNSVCCNSRCVPGNNCIGRSCVLQSGCGFGESCCNDFCVYGKDCHGQGCTHDFDCSGDEVCCSQKCTNGTNCIGQSCSKESDCQIKESCCKGTCQGSKCNPPHPHDTYIIIGVTAACVVTVVAVIVIFGYFNNRRRQQRLMAFSNVPFGHLAESTTSHFPQTVNNTFQQPPPEYTASVTPPQYTLTTSYGSSGMNATPKASVTSPHHQ